MIFFAPPGEPGGAEGEFSTPDQIEASFDTLTEYPPAKEDAAARATEAAAEAEKSEADAAAEAAKTGATETDEAAKAEAARIEKEKADAAAAEAEKNKPVEIPENDDDIEALQPKPNASEKTRNDFTAAKEAAKKARAAARAALSEAKTLREAQGNLPENISKELEDLRKEREEAQKFRAQVMLENDPVFVKEWTDKRIAADASVMTALEGAGLPQRTRRAT